MGCEKQIIVNIRTSKTRIKCEECKKRIKQEKIVNLKYTCICVICGTEFKNRNKVKTCSEKCMGYLQSINRSKYILKNGTNNFHTKQEEFSYKFVRNMLCDSKLEQAAIIYLVDELKMDSIERYKNILNFWEGNVHKTFNPDFYVKKNDDIYIVEVKMRWTGNSNHIYNRTMPLKKEVLKKYCEQKRYNMIWLDFDYDKKFRKIYKQLLRSN